jgi:secreted PhoX family phosphatase
MTYSRQEAGQQNNMFQNGPDNIHAVGDSLLYFTEDGGKNPGLFVSDTSGSYHTLFMADEPKYHGDETTGLAFSPSMKTLYCCLQEHGDCFSFTRKDGRQFTGLALNLRAHTAEILGLSNSLLDSLD